MLLGDLGRNMAVVVGPALRVSWISFLLIGGIAGFPSPTDYITQAAPKAIFSNTSASEHNASSQGTRPINPDVTQATLPQNSSASTSFNSPALSNGYDVSAAEVRRNRIVD
ncbi:hypothetical protein DPEC_G00172170 [Dallia pectoralis]|uniref:Uncharacterized protein n=1 Tax=Dallia pectoralis TaxID=75939 RepID=A0ACC2GDX7_DALPE|nr:hypothetical protein DPEC_G00172170 [Dallia pectoralis]